MPHECLTCILHLLHTLHVVVLPAVKDIHNDALQASSFSLGCVGMASYKCRYIIPCRQVISSQASIACSCCSLLISHWYLTMPGTSYGSMLVLLQDKREKQDKLAESNLYIKNLDDSQTDDKLRQLFEVGHPLPLLTNCRGTASMIEGQHEWVTPKLHRSCKLHWLSARV